MEGIVADQWTYVEWSFTAERSVKDELLIFIMDSCEGGSVARIADMEFYEVKTTLDFTPLDYELASSYNLNVNVVDSGGLTSTATIIIEVTDINEAPVLQPGKFFVMENSPVGTELGKVLATDPDGNNIITYSISVNGPNDDFAIDMSSGLLTVASQTIDYEKFQNANIEIIASDSGNHNCTTQELMK